MKTTPIAVEELENLVSRRNRSAQAMGGFGLSLAARRLTKVTTGGMNERIRLGGSKGPLLLCSSTARRGCGVHALGGRDGMRSALMCPMAGQSNVLRGVSHKVWIAHVKGAHRPGESAHYSRNHLPRTGVAQVLSHPGFRVGAGISRSADERRQFTWSGVMETRHSAEVVVLAAWRSGRPLGAPTLYEFGPSVAPIGWAQRLPDNSLLRFPLDGYRQFRGTGLVGVGNVAKVAESGAAPCGECLTLILGGKRLDEAKETGHGAITPSGVVARQHHSVSPRVSTGGMSDEASIRRENLKRLMAQRNWAVGTLPTTDGLGFNSYSYWRDLLKDPKKSFGEKVARQIEEKANLPRGWLDQAGAGFAEPAPAPGIADNAAHEPSDHELAFGLLSPEDQAEVHAIALALLQKNPLMASAIKRMGIDKRADDARVVEWKARIDAGAFAIPTTPKPIRTEHTTARQMSNPKGAVAKKQRAG